MENVIIAIIGSGALSTIISIIANRYQKKDDVAEGVMQLLGMSIRQRCEQAIEKGKISSEELAQLQSMNTVYKKLNGNGYIKVLMSKIESLTVFIDDDE